MESHSTFQPTHYMQNVPLTSVCETGVLLLGCSVSVPQGFLDLNDLAEVAGIVITCPSAHAFATYELVGQNVPYSSVAMIMQEETKRPIACEVLPVTEFLEKTRLIGAASSEYPQAATEGLVLYLNRW